MSFINRTVDAAIGTTNTAIVASVKTKPGNGDIIERVTLDKAYHYPGKEAFLCNACALLPGNGWLAISDLVFAGNGAPRWIKVVLWMLEIPPRNPWSICQYRRKLVQLGYEGVVAGGGRRLPGLGIPTTMAADAPQLRNYCCP